MDPPRVKNVMLVLELKRGCFIIAFIGLAIAVMTILSVVLYYAIEAILIHLQNYKVHGNVKVVITAILLINSIMLLVANGYLLIAMFTNKSSSLEISAYLLLAMVTVDIITVLMGPITCFFKEFACGVIKQSSHIVQAVIIIGLMIHMDLWAYYMVCVYSASSIDSKEN